MHARELTFKGESDPKLYACGACGKVYSPKIYAARDDVCHAIARRAAEKCCEPRFCECGTEIEPYWTACWPCREREMLAKATIIEAADYDGPVSSARCAGEWADGYSSEIEAMIQACTDAGDRVPAYCHPCTARRLQIDPVTALERATDEMHEGAGDQIVGADELISFINTWNSRQTCVTYYEDRGRVIVIDRPAFDDIMGGRAAQPASAQDDQT